MGAGEENTSKTSKPVTSMQEIPTTPSYPDWSNSMQAFYGHGATPPSFFPPTVASPAPHPYMWGTRHPLIPSYGTPVPYPAIYPPGTVFGHPNVATTIHDAPISAYVNTDIEGKVTDGKDRASAKDYKSTSGLTGRKLRDTGKAGSGSGNDIISQSADSVSEDSSDASDDDNKQQESTANKKGSFDQMLADGANSENNSNNGKSIVTSPATNRNIGMDLWNACPAGSGAKMRQTSGASMPLVPPNMSQNDHWVKDDRELKRQKRKQSNRESARRSRLRKQAECEDLQKRVEALGNENRTLRDELQRLSEECEKLTTENSSIKEELEHLCGPDGVANFE